MSTWKHPLDIFPEEWVGTEHEQECLKELEIGDQAKVIVDSQYNDSLSQRFEMIGTVIEIDLGDEWAYRLEFDDGEDNWFKRYHLEKQ